MKQAHQFLGKKHPFVSMSKQYVSILQFHLNKKPIVYNSSNTMAITKPSSSSTTSSTLSGINFGNITLSGMPCRNCKGPVMVKTNESIIMYV
jgi:hypothetical protein